MIHYTGMADGASALARLCDPAAGVSCHYLVWEDGRVDQLVAEVDRAWHAGIGRWAGEGDINSVSVGIEIVNGGHSFACPAYPNEQVAALTALARDICERHHIIPHRVLGHSDVAPSRKQDPGEHFPWLALASAGVGIWPKVQDGTPPAAFDEERMRHLLRDIGYDRDSLELNEQTDAILIAAFQRHWRPWQVDGCVDAETFAIAEQVANIVSHASKGLTA